MQHSAYFLLFMFVCVYKHILHVSKGQEKNPSAIRGAEAAESVRGALLKAALLALEASGCPLGYRGALTLHSFFPDTNQTQQHKHIQGLWGGYERERETETRRQTSEGGREGGRQGTRETLTHRQNAPSFNPQLRAFDNVFFHILLSVAPS